MMNFSSFRSGAKVFRAMGSRQFSKGHSHEAEAAEAARWLKVSVGNIKIFPFLYINFCLRITKNLS